MRQNPSEGSEDPRKSANRGLKEFFLARALWQQVLATLLATVLAAALLAGFGFLIHSLTHSSSSPAALTSTTVTTSTPTTAPPQTTSTTSTVPPVSPITAITSANPKLDLDPNTGSTGTSVTATATGFAPNENVQIYFQGELVGQIDANTSGSATIVFAVPSIASHFPGQSFTVSASGQTDADSAENTFTAS